GVLSSPTSSHHAQTVAHDVLGSIDVLRGRASRGRPHLLNAIAWARQIDLVSLELDSGGALARLEALSGRPDAAFERCADVVQRWERTDCELHYSVSVFRWMATFGAEQGSAELVQQCTSALARITVRSSVEALAALAHALGEAAMLEGDAAAAAAQ